MGHTLRCFLILATATSGTFDTLVDVCYYKYISIIAQAPNDTAAQARHIKAIDSKSFYNCVSIERFVIPASVTSIGSEAFYGWTANQTIEFLGHSENIFGYGWLIDNNATIVYAK